MDELFAAIGRLYVDFSRLQKYAEMLQTKVNELESQNAELINQSSVKTKDSKDSK